MNPTSNLLARYLQAIGEHLPAATRDDMLAELRANLQAQLDDRAEELNRPLTDPEVAAILKEHGRPILVAARYLPQQYLIGPAIFPYYLMTLRKAAPFALLIIFLANCSNLLFIHTFPELIAGILRALGLLIPDLIMFAAWLTGAFVIAEYVYTRNHAKPFNASWDPTKLPAIKPQFKGKSRASRIADLIFHCFWIIYILEIPSHHFLILGPSELYLRRLAITFAPIWHTYYVFLLVLLAVQLVTKILALNPTFDRLQSTFDLVTKLVGVASTAFLAAMKTYFVASGPAANQATLAAVNHGIGIAFRIVLILTVIDLFVEAWKLFRPSLRSKGLAF
ncbi:MAG TPA: hypothetical protein VK814_08850 [Acidobacteriaceae bacterium]|jgi:hypothetical protein|nr:hypothetical protein [Acidobacteriaceae bacterium]